MTHLKTERFESFSNNIRIDYFNYKGVNLHEQTRIPHFWGKEPSNTVILDLQFPSDSYDCLMDGLYCSEGYGVPVFGELEQAKNFIDMLKESAAI